MQLGCVLQGGVTNYQSPTSHFKSPLDFISALNGVSQGKQKRILFSKGRENSVAKIVLLSIPAGCKNNL